MVNTWPTAHTTRMIWLTSSSGQGWMHGENRWWCKKLYQDLFHRKNSQKVGKKQVHEDSDQSIKDLQSSLAKALATSWAPLMSYPSLNEGQTTIKGLIEPCQVIFAGVTTPARNGDSRFLLLWVHMVKYMLKQAQLVEGEFRPQTRKNWR